ncbi:MAG: helix-turn-helix domain-containing protein [Clostridia bacterium]|nr:helix-turn-helix domain-containing protein [Clostridia bacterium]
MEKLTFNCKIIKEYLKSHNFTIKKFCEKCTIKYYDFRKIMKNDLTVYSNVLYKICKTMNIKLADLIIVN